MLAAANRIDKHQRRRERFMPGGVPRWLRIYDNEGRTADRYTIVFSGRYTHKTAGEHWVLGMSADPYWPQGVCMHVPSKEIIDRPRYSHLGKPIAFTDLPRDCQCAVLQDYMYLWDLCPLDDNLSPSRAHVRQFLPTE